MAGHLGVERVTVQNLKVVSVDDDKGFVFLQGAIPGFEGGYVMVYDAVKKKLPEKLPYPAGLKAKAAAVDAEKKD